jgi:hypothetical protein
MMPSFQFEISWGPRRAPLLPVAVAARGEAALRLARRLLLLDDESLARLSGVAGHDVIVVQGEAEDLPWVEGVGYLGVESEAPFLLLPTNYEASWPAPLLARAFAARVGESETIAVLPQPGLLVPMKSARPVSRGTLTHWIESFGEEARP